MKKTKSILIVLFIFFSAASSTFSISNNKDMRPNLDPPDEFTILLKYMESNVNFINEGVFPIISADEVKKNLKNPKYQIIDIRSETWFDYGHIKGAKNLEAENLPVYFKETIKPDDFDKIILVCYSGQSASYYAGLLQIAGYKNVYSMQWGMSSWREDFAENAWLKNIGNSVDCKIETTESSKPTPSGHPQISTGKTAPNDILMARLTELFKMPYKDFIVKPEDVFENPNDFFVVDYTTKEHYDSGHLAGAINYMPGASLTSTTDLLTLPTEQRIVVYDATGLKTAYVVAYLNVLGYHTGNLAYGENAFMNDTLKDQDMEAFTKNDINMYPVVE